MVAPPDAGLLAYHWILRLGQRSTARRSGRVLLVRYREPPKAMIEALKSNEIADKVGGRFKLTVLIQRRLVELLDGSRPLVDRKGRSDLEVVIDEIMQDKITLEFVEPAKATELPPAPTRSREALL
jgi:DNA-directed RNA polymerase subunit omega